MEAAQKCYRSRMRSLTSRLLVLWVLSVAVCTAVGLLLLQFYDQSTTAQVQRAEAIVIASCGMIQDRYRFYVSGSGKGGIDPGMRADLDAVAVIALHAQQGVEGGIWQAGAGPLAYAYPTYQGSGPKTDLPAAERNQIAAVNAQARREEQTVLQRSVSAEQTRLLASCPLSGPFLGLTAWTMARVNAMRGFAQLQAGLGVLLALVLGMSLWLTWLVASWSRSVRAIEAALGATHANALPVLHRTGERELDRIVGALNDATSRLAEARARSDQLARQVAVSERMAALGRVAAGVAHEIRNPIAAMRIRAESAQRGDDSRRRRALGIILEQIERLDRLVAQLLAMTQRPEPVPRRIELRSLLEEIGADYREQAEAKGVRLQIEAPCAQATLDPDLLRRALGNLLLNAIQHTPAGGCDHAVRGTAAEAVMLRLVVG